MINFDFNSDLIRQSDISIPHLVPAQEEVYIGNPIDTFRKVSCNLNFIASHYNNPSTYFIFNIVSFNILESDSLSGQFTPVEDERLTGDFSQIRNIFMSGQDFINIYKVGVFGTKRFIKVTFSYGYSAGNPLETSPQIRINFSLIPMETK